MHLSKALFSGKFWLVDTHCYLSLVEAFCNLPKFNLKDLAKNNLKECILQDAYLGRAPTAPVENAG